MNNSLTRWDHTKNKRIQNALRLAVERQEIAGALVLVRRGEDELCYLEEGLADIEKASPMRRDTIFRCYSMSKPVTSAAAMLLLQDGLIEPMEPLSRYFPEYTNMQVVTKDGVAPAQRPVLIRDLLNMTSGISYPGCSNEAEAGSARVYWDFCKRLGSDSMGTTEEFARRMGGCPLSFEPGTSWQYGASADVLGAVIEKVAGMSFGEFLRRRLFDPLGMKDTGFSVPDAKLPRLAKVYAAGAAAPADAGEADTQAENAEKNTPSDSAAGSAAADQPANGSAIAGSGKGLRGLSLYTGCNLAIRNDGGANPFESGGAGLHSTIDDYMAFARMLMRGGRSAAGEQILSPGIIRYMTDHSLSAAQQAAFDTWDGLEGFTYGNFLRVMKDPSRAATPSRRGEYGWDGWLGTYFGNFPDEDMTFLMMMQTTDYGTGILTRRLRSILLG